MLQIEEEKHLCFLLPLLGKHTAGKAASAIGFMAAPGAQSKGKSKGKPGGPAPPPAPKCTGQSQAKSKPCMQVVEAVHTACQFDDEEALGALLRQRAPADPDVYLRRSLTPLHTASVNGSCRVLRLLLAEGANVDARNHWKETALHMACAGAQSSAITALVEARAAVEAADHWGRTPFRVAWENGQKGAVAQLVAAGAQDVQAQDVFVASPSVEQDVQHRALAQEIACLVQARSPAPMPEPTVKHMFAPTHSTPSGSGRDAAIKDGRQPLSKLVEYPGDPGEVAQLLSRQGSVDPAGRDAFGLTALHKFAAWNKVDLAQLLLEVLDDDDVNAAGGDEGFTALHHAVSMGAINAVELLLRDPRVSRNEVDKSNRTPVDLALATLGCEGLAQCFDAQ